MPTFDTPEPISVNLELGVGDVSIVASDRPDTVVDVGPSDPAKRADVSAAEQTQVEYASGRLQIKGPKGWRTWASRRGESVDVRIDLPTGSRFSGETGVVSLRCRGRLGDVRYRTGVGDVRLDEAGPLELKTGAGEVTVESVLGPAEITTGSGAVRVGRVDGSAGVKNSNGDTWIGEVAGEARLRAANGAISVDVAHASVDAKSANGRVRVGQVERGEIVAQSHLGSVEIGVRDGVAAWLDLETRFGAVQRDLDAAERPGPGEDAVEVHARTSMGDIAVRRSSTPAAGRAEE
jgi:DUF4097 and DUF4098 domain-containing protein YvlB